MHKLHDDKINELILKHKELESIFDDEDNPRQSGLLEELLQARDLLRSADSIAKRDGIKVNWEAFRNQLTKYFTIK